MVYAYRTYRNTDSLSKVSGHTNSLASMLSAHDEVKQSIGCIRVHPILSTYSKRLSAYVLIS